MKLGEKILAVTKERGMDLKTLSRVADIPYNTLRGYTRPGSRRLPSGPKSIVLAKALDVPTDWLFDDSAGLPAPPRLQSPPFRIRPWPPDEITWEELRTVLAAHQLAKTARDAQKLIAAIQSTPDPATEFRRKGPKLVAILRLAGQSYLDLDDEGKRAMDRATGDFPLGELANLLGGTE